MSTQRQHPSGFYINESNNVQTMLSGVFINGTSLSSATELSLTGPVSAIVGTPSDQFTILGNGPMNGTTIVTPSDSGAGGTFSPSAVTLVAGQTSGSFTYTPINDGSKSITISNDAGLVNPAAYNLTSYAIPGGSVTSTTYNGQSVTIGFTTSGTPVSGMATLSPATPANGSVEQGPSSVTLSTGSGSITFAGVPPGDYLSPTITLTNPAGAGSVSGGSNVSFYRIGGSVTAKKSSPIPVTTFTIENTSTSAVSSNFVTPMFGHPFKMGDVPPGYYPRFETSDGTSIPYTMFNKTSWSDGSLKFASFILRVPSSVSGSGTISINVKRTSIAPVTSSSRTTVDLNAADLSVSLTGVTNLSGEWVASLNTAITDATDVTQIGDGPAGKVWRIGGPFKQAGSAHGQMHCWHYVAALQDAAGGLYGLRYLGHVAQPWADVSAPAATRRVVTAALKSGASIIRNLQGHDTAETVGANIGFGHYTGFFTADVDGKWDYVQGGGTVAADATVRIKHDKSYFVQSRLLPPYDTTVTATSTASVDYRPYGKAALGNRNLNSTGASNFIGVIPLWAVTHLMTQAAVDERAVRTSALACAGFRTTVRRSTTGKIIPVADVQASYTGLGTIQTTWRYGGGFYTGVQNPTDATSLWSGDTDSSHRPSAFYYAYLITGEPQYLDALTDYAAQIVMYTDPGTYTRTVTTPVTSLRTGSYTGLRNVTVGATTYKGAGLLYFGGGVRIAAWATRDIGQAAAVIPDADTTGTKAYFKDILDQAYQSVNAVNAAMPQSWRDAGLFSTTSNSATSPTSDALYESPWMTMYLSSSVCHQQQITEIASAATLRAHLAKFLSAVHAQMDLTCMSTYRWKQWKDDGSLVVSVSDVLFYVSTPLAFDATADTATLSGTFGDWNPTNGDKIAFSTNLNANKPFVGATNEKAFFVVNAAGKVFQLAETAGGAAIDVTSTVTVGTWMAQIQNASPEVDFESGDYYMRLTYEAARFHEACGDSGINAARLKQDSNITAGAISFATDPRSALLPAY